MSTKIYNAYEFTPGPANLARLHKCLLRLRKVCIERHMAEGILASVRPSMARAILNNAGEASSLRSDVTDDAVVYLTIPGRVFVQFFCGRLIEDKIRSNRDFKDFHYQDQTDPPRHVSKKAYDAREKVWDAIMLRSDATPAIAGYTFSLCSVPLLMQHLYNIPDKKV